MTKKRRGQRRWTGPVVSRILVSILVYSLLTTWAIITAYPLLWAGITSLKTSTELFTNPFAFPSQPQWVNYYTAWELGNLGRCAFNSMVVTVSSCAVGLSIATACAFAFARLNFGVLKTFLWTYIMFGFLVPDSVRFFPLMIFLNKIGLYDSLLALILIYSAGGVPWNTFFMRTFMERIPRELEDAAVVDGAGVWQVFRHVIVPLSRAPLVTLATFHTLFAWNEFMMAFFLTASTQSRTLPVGVRMLAGAYRSNYPGLAAGLVITMIPMVVIFILLQRHVVRGMTAGALVG